MNSIISPLKERYNIDHVAYHRYRDNIAEVFTDDQHAVNYFLNDSNSISPVDLVDDNAVLSWADYHSGDCLSSIETSYEYNTDGVTFCLKHDDGYAEHIALASKDSNTNLMRDVGSQSEIIQNVVSYIRSQIHLNERELKSTVYQRMRLSDGEENDSVDNGLLLQQKKKQFIYGRKGAAFITGMEKECLLLLLQLKTIDEISKQLGLSSKTVDYYIVKLKKKLGVDTRSQMYQVAVNNFLL